MQQNAVVKTALSKLCTEQTCLPCRPTKSPQLTGDSCILDSISRSPATSSKSPAFYKQSQFSFNSTAKITPRMHPNSHFELKNRKIFWGGAQPLLRPHTQWGGGHQRLAVSAFGVSISPSMLVSR